MEHVRPPLLRHIGTWRICGAVRHGYVGHGYVGAVVVFGVEVSGFCGSDAARVFARPEAGRAIAKA